MKLQHLSVIFIIIMLPISLIISAYTQMQIDTLILQNQYDAKLMNATYDAVKAFDINTTGNDMSNIADALRKDIQAAISTFMTSFASNMGLDGSADRYVKPYVPALLFTLYDGYYIYAPTLTDDGYIYTLQPYNYYSIRYKNGDTDIVVNYTLDNYIVIYGYVNGKYTVKSGYLIAEKQEVNEETEIYEYVPVAQLNNNIIQTVDIVQRNVADSKYNAPTDPNGEYLYARNELYYIDSKSAINYYNEAKAFTNWVTSELGDIKPYHALRNNMSISEFEEDDFSIFSVSESNNPEKVDSNFNQHRMEVIENTIENNLNYAITAYANSAGANQTAYNFRLPKIDADDWVTISSNICMVSFVQGMPVGSRYYNNYAIVKSTTNKFFVDPNNIYYIEEGGEYYHKIDCPELDGEKNITGFSNYSFQKFSITADRNGVNTTIPYWRHTEKACYYCIVGNKYNSECGKDEKTGKLNIEKLSINKQKAYYTTVAREKYRQYTTTNYFGETNKETN